MSLIDQQQASKQTNKNMQLRSCACVCVYPFLCLSLLLSVSLYLCLCLSLSIPLSPLPPSPLSLSLYLSASICVGPPSAIHANLDFAVLSPLCVLALLARSSPNRPPRLPQPPATAKRCVRVNMHMQMHLCSDLQSNFGVIQTPRIPLGHAASCF